MTDSCCSIPNPNPTVVGADLCPTCGQKGKPVAALTINTLVYPELKPPGGYPDGYYCPNPDDATIYFFPDERAPLSKGQVTVRVGFKEAEPPRLVCYCFEHTREEIQQDFLRQGESTIKADIREKVAAGLCSCEVKNPKGKCCVGDVRAAYRELETAHQAPV